MNNNRIKNTLTIIQPGRNGDILLTIPIAYYMSQTYNIRWPICFEFKPLLNYVNFPIEVIDIGPFKGRRAFECYQACYRKIHGEDLDLAIGWGNIDLDRKWKATETSFDQWKYDQVAIPISEKYNLKKYIRRNIIKENALCKELNIAPYDDEYILVHEHGSNNRYFNFNIPSYLKNYKKIEIKPILDFTIFDWLLIIENCKAIFCVDSCIANLIDMYNILYTKPKIFHYWKEYYTPLQIKLLTPKLGKNWTFQ